MPRFISSSVWFLYEYMSIPLGKISNTINFQLSWFFLKFTPYPLKSHSYTM